MHLVVVINKHDVTICILYLIWPKQLRNIIKHLQQYAQLQYNKTLPFSERPSVMPNAHAENGDRFLMMTTTKLTLLAAAVTRSILLTHLTSTLPVLVTGLRKLSGNRSKTPRPAQTTSSSSAVRGWLCV